MTIWYVAASGGSDSNAGTAASAAFLTLAKAATCTIAGDTVNVRQGVYRELLTISTSGSSGAPVTWNGDYSGSVFGDVTGASLVRITGSNDDQAASRVNCISATSKSYQTFTGFVFEWAASRAITLLTSCCRWTIDKCVFNQSTITNSGIELAGSGTVNTIQNCVFWGGRSNAIYFNGPTTISSASHLVQNCIFVAQVSRAIADDRTGGITVRNCTFFGDGGTAGINVITPATAGSPAITVNNSIFVNFLTAISGSSTNDITENFNAFFGNSTDRTNTSVGANSNTFPPQFDMRWAMQLLFSGAGPNNAKQVVSPFDLAGYSGLVNLAGTAPTTTDARGTAIIGAQREWGALEYDKSLLIDGATKSYFV